MDLIIKGSLIEAPIIEILEKCKSELTNGKLGNIVDKGDWVSVPCPFHSDGKESHNSCGIVSDPNSTKEYGTFHCFRGDTKVITREYGAIEMATIVGKPVHILNGNGEWEQTVFTSYGIQNLMQVNLVSNRSTKQLFATQGHEWLIKGYNRKQKTTELKQGMYLQKCTPKLRDDIEIDPKGIVHGYCYGDGTQCGHNKSNTHRYYSCYFCDKYGEEIEHYFTSIYKKDIGKTKGGNGILYDRIGISSERKLKEVPSLQESDSYLLGFLAGYFVADGNCNENRLSICSYKYDDLYKVQQICTKLGIVTTKIGVGNVPAGKRGILTVKKDTKYYCLRLSETTVPLSFFISSKGRGASAKYTKNRYKVVSVEATDLYEPVYCCQTSTHSFALEHHILTGNCFTCGEKGNLAKFIAQCFNTDISYGEQWLIKNFGRSLNQRIYNLEPIELKPKYKAYNYLNEGALNYLQPYHPYMTERKLTREVIEKFKIKYNPNKKTIVFPVWDINGNYLFNTERSVVGKTFFIPPKVQKPVYLLNYIMQNGIDTVIVVESQINALTCYGYGLNAVALFGTGDDFQYDLLNKSCIRHYYLAFDGDDAGYKAIARFKEHIRKDVFVDIIKIPFGEDVNSLSKETFLKLFEESKNN